MGILNVTPDSFSDGNRFVSVDQALRHALQMEQDGAQVIDIGGESTRPGATPVSLQEELDRVMPVIERLRQASPVRLSIDTMKPAVMKAAVKAGVWMVNDVHALQSSGALETVKPLSCQLCLMHKQGMPHTMQQSPHYAGGVVQDVRTFLLDRLQACEAAGIERQRVWIDPGIGFGKNLMHNVALLQSLQALNPLGLSMLLGVSRKSLLGDLTGQPVHQRVSSGIAVALHAMLQGVNMIRTHDVRETHDALCVWQIIQLKKGSS